MLTLKQRVEHLEGAGFGNDEDAPAERQLAIVDVDEDGTYSGMFIWCGADQGKWVDYPTFEDLDGVKITNLIRAPLSMRDFHGGGSFPPRPATRPDGEPVRGKLVDGLFIPDPD